MLDQYCDRELEGPSPGQTGAKRLCLPSLVDLAQLQLRPYQLFSCFLRAAASAWRGPPS